MNVAGVVPVFPSVTVGLDTESASGSSSAIVRVAEASPSVAFSGSESDDRERLVGLDGRVAADGDVDDRLCLARAAKTSLPEAAR